MQDNDPKHVNKSTLQFIRDNGINYLPTPPESPDMNPIECILANFKQHIIKYVKPRKRAELIDGINKYWSTMSVQMCNTYIDHLYKKVQVGKVQEKAQSEKDSHSKNQGGKKPN